MAMAPKTTNRINKSEMKRLFYIALAAILSALCVGCSGRSVYSHYEPLPVSGWHADSAIVYDFAVADSSLTYDLVLNLRHTDLYPHQNFWVFADLYRDSLLLSSDTLDYYLADQRGRWLGNGFGGRRDMPMLYKHQFLFPFGGNYRLSVRHGMRTTLLTGVSDLGLTIDKAGE